MEESHKNFIIIIIFLHGLGRLTCSGFDAFPSFPRASTIEKREARLRETNWSFEERGFCGWAGNPPKENKVLISKDAQPWISADQMKKDLAGKKKIFMLRYMYGDL